MTKKEIVKELREILKVYHYKSEEQHMSKDVVTSLENLLGSLLKWNIVKDLNVILTIQRTGNVDQKEIK